SGTIELPSLAPSMVATLNSDRTAGGYTPTVLSPVSETELPPAEVVISGQQLIAIDVVRKIWTQINADDTDLIRVIRGYLCPSFSYLLPRLRDSRARRYVV